ncbi:MAG: hypothetical protein CSA32_04140 [Desulfobulbus propionicus]|nr:MAG: hypothetical protein CSA32_04140 [Desulfobulbus propionicus]
MKRKLLIHFIIFTISISSQASAAVEAVTTGIASPQSKEEENNIEILRQRALRNAMDLAVIQVTGATISGEKGSSYRTKEHFSSDSQGDQESSDVQSRYSTGAVTRTEGHAKLVELIKEWQESGQYYIHARFAVETEKEAVAKRNAGYFWKKAGSPRIGLSFSEIHNGELTKTEENRTVRFLRDSLVRNKLEVSSDPRPAYLIEIKQVLDSRELEDFGTTTITCRLSYRIIDQQEKTTVKEFRTSNGPEAGFNQEMAVEKCIAAIAPDLARHLVRNFAEIMNDRAQNGIEYQLVLEGVPGDMVTRVAEITRNLYRVTSFTSPQYVNAKYSGKVHFKGSGAELAQSLTETFRLEDWQVAVTGVSNGHVQLKWIEKK